MSCVFVSGASGFIGGYVVQELLSRGYTVVGLDNFSKYGKISHRYDDDSNYRLVEGDARDADLLYELLVSCDHFIAGAAMIGGITYFHTYAYDLLATNERIIAASCDAAIKAFSEGGLKKVTYLSSSMVFESATSWPSLEGQELKILRRTPRTGSRSSPWSTSPERPATSTGCRSRSSVPSTVSGSGSSGLRAAPKS